MLPLHRIGLLLENGCPAKDYISWLPLPGLHLDVVQDEFSPVEYESFPEQGFKSGPAFYTLFNCSAWMGVLMRRLGE